MMDVSSNSTHSKIAESQFLGCSLLFKTRSINESSDVFCVSYFADPVQSLENNLTYSTKGSKKEATANISNCTTETLKPYSRNLSVRN